MYTLAMYIIAHKMYTLAPKMEKVYFLKRYSPCDSFWTFFLRVQTGKRGANRMVTEVALIGNDSNMAFK